MEENVNINWAHLLLSTPNSIFQFFSLPWWYGFLNTCTRTTVFTAYKCCPTCDGLLRDHSVTTLPISRSLLVSLRLMWRSTLVSPLLMSTTCHRVRPPRATATELQGGGRGVTSQAERSAWCFTTFIIRWNTCEAGPHLVSTQRKMIHLWAVVSAKVLVGGGVW